MPEVFAIRPEAPSADDRWIMPGRDLRPPIKNDWALYLDWEHDDPTDLRVAASAIMKEWAGITSLDGRIFSGREQRAMDPREYYKLAVGAFKAGSLTSLFSPEWMEFHEAEGRGDKAAMRALAAKNIRGEGVAAAVGAAADKHVHNSTAAELEEMRRSLGAVRDAMTPDDLETLDHPYRLGMGYVQGVTDLYKKYHGTIEDERRLDAYRKQLADENQWAVIESIKGHVTENARNVLEMALESADDPTNRTVMEAFGKLSTPEMRSIAGALQALHYDRDPNFKALCADAGRAFMNTLESVTAGAVRGATDLLQRTWMDGAEYRDMVDRRVLLEDANRERMADWGIVGNAVIGAASTIPYMAAAAVPYVGMADMMLTARDEFQSQAARNGVDVSSPDFILGSSAFAIAYAYVEKIQWEKAFGGIANLSRRQMYCDVFHSVRAALGVAGAFAGTVLTESGEEGIQAALEEAATHWGQGTTLADEVKAFTEDFVGSLGTMAIIGAFGGAKQGLAYRHGALGFDVADALAAQSRILELDRHMAGHPGEVGPLADYGRTYGRMVEDWINAGTDVERRQASLMRWGLTKEQATAIHGALQNIWTSIEGSDASAERKAEQKSALVGGGHVLTPGEMIARIQNGGYLGKVEQLADGSQAVNMDIAGTTLRMVVQPKREASRIDENDSALFESIVNELNSRNILDADGAKFTVERWTNLTPEQRRDIIETNELYNQGYALFYDMDGNRLDGRVLDAITGNVHMTDVALPQTAFHETMHGVLRLLTNMARGEKAGDGGWKVEPAPAAAALVGELAEIFPALSEREAVNEEALANAFQAYMTDRVGAVEHTGLLDRLGRFLARLFGYGGHTYEIGNARTAHQRLFNTAITGHIAQAVQEAAGEAEAAGRAEVRTETEPGAQAEPGAEGEAPDAPTPTAAGGAEAVLRLMEADYPELAPLAAMFRNGDPLVHEQMASLVKATGGRLDTDLVWAAGYRWNGVQERWEHDERLERPLDERDRPQQPYMGADGELQEAEARVGAEGLGAEAARPQVASRLPSPEFAMDGTIVDALPAHLREDGRAIVAERGGTAAWMVEADGTPTELNEREWLRREAERRHGAGRYAVSGRAPTAEELAETQRQYDDVVARFTNPDGTKKAGWLKAPNGKPTRLTEQQWVQVRTENFKRWFGDWEAADLQRFLEGPAVGTAAGNEFAGSSRDAVALEMRAFFDSLGGVAANQFLGDVQLTHKGINDTIRKGMGRLKYAAFKLVPAIIENGRVVQVDANWKQRGYGTAVIAAPIAIGTIPHVAVVVIHRYQNGDQNFYLHEVSPLSVLKKGIAGLRSSLAEGGEGGSSRDFSNILARPLFSVNPDSVSKVVDENGEPLVVWHGSRWNPLEEKPGDAVFGKSSTPSQGSYLKDRQGFFFANKEVAEGYGVNDPMAFFINAREPYTVDVRDELRELDYDIETEREEAEAAGYPIGRWLGEGDEEFEANDSATAYLDDNMSEIMARSDENRADAVLVKGADGSFVAVVFDPTQIKSATDNVGTFDSASPDIRYQIAGRAGAERLGIRGLGDAEAMERSGATQEDIWRETGWWRGADGKWRVEIPDFTLSMETLDREAYGNDPDYFVRKRKLPDLIGDTRLFDAYPQLRRVTVQTPHSDQFGGLNTYGDYNNGTRIRLNMSAMQFNPDEVRATLAHEIQHAIQAQEGLAQGGNAGQFKPVDVAKMRRKAKAERKRGNVAEADRLETEADEMEENALDGMVVVDNQGYMDEFEAYQSLAGEVEARNVEKRLNMTPEERAATPPWETEDVEEGRQIVRFSIGPVLIPEKGIRRREASEILAGLRGQSYTNHSTGIVARLASRGAGKLVSDEAVEKTSRNGFTRGQHYALASKIDTLFENAVLIEDRPDRDGDVNIKSIKRFAHPVTIGTTDAVAWITVKESTKHGNRIYSVEGIKIAALSPYVKRALADNNSADNATTDTQPQTAGEVNGENGRRGSVAGTDPGWWDVPGQAEAAAQEGRELARHGLSFGGPAFSHRSYVEAFAARDRALGFKRSDEDYKRLIDAFGLTGKMTVADAKAAGEALQAEMHGAAATVAELAKQAEKKNFRKTVDRLFTGAAGYGIEVGANARQAWAEYVARMRRLAKGRNAKNMAADAGLVFWELLLAAGPEGFEAQEKGKAGKAADTDDEAAALEAALIDGREGDLGYTAETAKARLAELLEAKKGDVAARNARLKARLAEWRRQEAARLAALQARQEAEAARQAEAGEKDGAADGEGKGKGDKPQESEEEEAVAEMPDFRAFIQALQEDGWDLANPGEFAAVLRFYVEDWLAEKNGIAPGDVMKDPVAAAEYRTTVQEILRDSCNQLLDPNDGAAVRIAERMLGEIPGDASAAEIEARSRSIIGFIKRNAIRQSRKKLVAAIIEDIKKLAIQGKMFDETEKDIGRKITGEREPYARYVARILLWGDKRIAAEMQRLNDVISGRLDAYRAARAEDAALEDLQRTDREIHRATERLAALQLWGGLRKKSPAEIALAGQQIHQWLETERDAHEKRWTEWKGRNDAMAAALEKAFTADRRDYTPDDPGFVGMAAEELTTNFRMRLERLAAGSGAEGRRAIDQVMMLIYAGSERLGALKAARRQRTDAMLERCVEGTGMKVGDFLKSLDEPIPEALNRELATEEQPVRMTWGQALQLLGELEQTASYSMNIAANGRAGHRDLILAALADKPQMLRLLEEMRRIYEEDRTALSDEFFAVTGNPILSPDPLYLPARMFTGARDSLETTVRAWNPFGPAFTPRISNKRDFDLSASIMDVYNARMKETATALAFGMRGMELRSILARKSVQEAIAQTHGKYALRKMIAHLTDIVSDGYKGDGGQMEWYRRAIRALGDITTYSALSWNAVTMLKQMTSIPAWTALLDGGYGEIFRHITNFDAEAARELCRSPGFVARYGATGFGKMFRQELENPQGGNVVARLFKAGMTAVQMGDFVPGILVGTGVYKARKLALLRKGLAEPAAREQAARETWGLIEENQQSSRLENTPEILRRGGFIGRQLSKFATSPMMQVAHEIHTLRMWLAEARIEARHGGKESGAVKALMNAQGDDAVRWRKRFVNQLICNHVLMPAAMYAIATIFKACLGGEPPDKEEIYGDLLMQMVAGPWSRIFLIGALADQTGEWVARMAGGKPNVYSRGDLAATQHLHKALAQVGRIGGDVADLDWASVRDDFVKMASSYNAPIRYAATAIQNAAGYDPAKARRERKREIARREAAAQ